jgi:hypothetical protein
MPGSSKAWAFEKRPPPGRIMEPASGIKQVFQLGVHKAPDFRHRYLSIECRFPFAFIHCFHAPRREKTRHGE